MQLEKEDWFCKTSIPEQGIRTLSEVAHFVRQISLMPEDSKTQLDDVWSTPDVMLTMKQG